MVADNNPDHKPHDGLLRFGKRYWWPSWACGVVLAWCGFFMATAIISRIAHDSEMENVGQFVVAVFLPASLTLVVPCLWVVVGMATLLGRRKGDARRLSSPEAFTITLIVGAIVAVLVGADYKDVGAGVVIHFATGQLFVGMYIPFTLALLASWGCGRTASKWWTASLLSLSIVAVCAGILLGVALGKHGA